MDLKLDDYIMNQWALAMAFGGEKRLDCFTRIATHAGLPCKVNDSGLITTQDALDISMAISEHVWRSFRRRTNDYIATKYVLQETTPTDQGKHDYLSNE